MEKNNPMRISMQYFAEPAADPQPAVGADGAATDPSAANADPAVAKAEEAKPVAAPEKTHTQADIDAAVEAALAKAKQEAENAKDYDKMTPEQKVAYLEAERNSTKLADFARAEIAKAELPVECIDFVKGKDETDTAARIQSFKAMFSTAVQSGVDKRFKDSGYEPQAGRAPTSLSGTNSLADAIAEVLK